MRARSDGSERVLVIESEAVRGEAVGCIAWLGLSREVPPRPFCTPAAMLKINSAMAICNRVPLALLFNEHKPGGNCVESTCAGGNDHLAKIQAHLIGGKSFNPS